MSGIRKSLLQFVFSGASMSRWNDKLRPVELVEIDKQGHKMIVAWLLYELNSRHLTSEERLDLGQKIVEGGLFDYLYRLVITDIKPPVFYRIRENEEDYQKLTTWVLAKLEHIVRPLDEGFWQRLTQYFDTKRSQNLADRILSAAHSYASGWEFNVLKNLNTFDPEMKEIEESFKVRLGEFMDIVGVQDLMHDQDVLDANSITVKASALGAFASFCGQLRFQKRWSQTPRIPESSVLGHMFIVASYGYFFSLQLGAKQARCNNNFFCGLFHDLPELLTRDIISPVKQSVAGLPDLIRAYEDQELERRIFAPLRGAGQEALVARLCYFLGMEIGSEFKECIIKEGKVCEATLDDLQADFGADCYDPKDGRMLKVCDILAAFMEAHTSIRNGIAPPELWEAMARFRNAYRGEVLGNIHMGALFADFD
ncbi:MAG: HD domain-containing protein [Pseudomonadota bacterium]